MPPAHEAAGSLFERDGLLDGLLDGAAAGDPLVAQLGPDVQVDGGDDAHVGLAPLAAAEGDLAFEQLERVQSQGVLGDLEEAAQDGAGFVLHEEQAPVGFALGDFLEEAQVRGGGVEEAWGVGGEGDRGQEGGGVAEFVDFGILRCRERGGRGWGGVGGVRGDGRGVGRLRGWRVGGAAGFGDRGWLSVVYG